MQLYRGQHSLSLLSVVTWTGPGILSDWSKPMFCQNIKHGKVGFIVFRPLPLYYEANEEAKAMYYTVIKHSTADIWEHSRNVENTRLWLMFSTFPYVLKCLLC